MATVTWTLTWQAVSGITRYDILEYSLASATSSLLGTAVSSVTTTGISMDESTNKVVQVRGYDGTAYNSVETFVQGRPTILAQLRKEVRRELNDTEASAYKWTNEEINQYIIQAIEDYSKHFPRDRSTTLTTVDEQRDYTLAGAVKIKNVFYLRDSVRYYLKPKEWKGGELELIDSTPTTFFDKLGVRVRTGSRYYGGHYTYDDDTLSVDFDPDVGYSLVVDYGAVHTIPLLDTDAMTIAQSDWEILSLYAQAKAWSRDAGKDASLSRWDDNPGRRDDNPLIPRETRLFNAYTQKIKEKKGSRIRTMRRVRV